jgi:hypothetical protein
MGEGRAGIGFAKHTPRVPDSSMPSGFLHFALACVKQAP